MKESIVIISKNREFVRVYRMGRRAESKYCRMYMLKNKLSTNRFGFSVSKKVGNSVVRHRVKRLYLEVLRRMQNELRTGYDIVVVAKNTASEMTFSECRHDVKTALGRLGLWGKGERMC